MHALRRLPTIVIITLLVTATTIVAHAPAASAGTRALVTLPGTDAREMIRDESTNRLFLTEGDRLLVLDPNGTVVREHLGVAGRYIAIDGGVAYVTTDDGDVERFDTHTLDRLTAFDTNLEYAVTWVAVDGYLFTSALAQPDVGPRAVMRISQSTGTTEAIPGTEGVGGLYRAGSRVLAIQRQNIIDVSSGSPVIVSATDPSAPYLANAVSNADGTLLYIEAKEGPDDEVREWDLRSKSFTGRSIRIDRTWINQILTSPLDGGSIFVRRIDNDGSHHASRYRASDLSLVWTDTTADSWPAMAPAADGNGLHVVLRYEGNQFATLPTPPAPAPPPGPGGFHPITPARLVDTRERLGMAALGPGTESSFAVLDRGGVPAAGVSAVVLNVTATMPTDESYLTVWPAGRPRPVASSLNFRPGATVPNLVTSGIGPNGTVAVFNAAGAVHVVVDVVGWYDTGNTVSSRLEPVWPRRIFDSRTQGWTFARNGTFNLQATAAEPAPMHAGDVFSIVSTAISSDLAAVLNITVTNPTQDGYLTIWPSGSPRPLASSLNFVAGQTTSNAVIVGLGYGFTDLWHTFDIYSPFGDVEVIVDVAAHLTTSSSAAGFTPITPTRVLDTRQGSSRSLGSRQAGVLTLPPEFFGGPIVALALNVTVTGTTESSFLSLWPANRPPGALSQLTSLLNWTPGQSKANFAVIGVPSDGRITFFNWWGETHVVVDVVGIYTTP